MVLYLNGACGDVNPTRHRGGFEAATATGEAIAECVVEVLGRPVCGEQVDEEEENEEEGKGCVCGGEEEAEAEEASTSHHCVQDSGGGGSGSGAQSVEAQRLAGHPVRLCNQLRVIQLPRQPLPSPSDARAFVQEQVQWVTEEEEQAAAAAAAEADNEFPKSGALGVECAKACHEYAEHVLTLCEQQQKPVEAMNTIDFRVRAYVRLCGECWTGA